MPAEEPPRRYREAGTTKLLSLAAEPTLRSPQAPYYDIANREIRGKEHPRPLAEKATQ